MIGSSPVVGSSYRMSCGSMAMARASPTRLRMPPDSAGRLQLLDARRAPPLGQLLATRGRISSSGIFVCSRSGRPTFSPTVIESNSAALWNSMPKRRRTSCSSSSLSADDVLPVDQHAPVVGRASGR